MTARTTYRNLKMRDVDFYVVNITSTEVIGYWLLRSSGAVMSLDRIDRDNINPADWTEVSDG